MALGAEQVALAAGLLWLMQMQSQLPERGTIWYDCMATGKATDGQWQAPSELGGSGSSTW